MVHLSLSFHRPLRPGLFLDRDGLLIEDVGYLRHLSDIRWLPGVLPALATLSHLDIGFVVVTNQSAIGRGLLSIADLDRIHSQLRSEAGAAGARLDAIYYCPHHPTLGIVPYRIHCRCRKPQPGMILAAARDLNLDLSQSVMVGDKCTDVEAGSRAGTHALFVGPMTQTPLPPCDATFPSLDAATPWLWRHFTTDVSLDPDLHRPGLLG